LFCHNRYDERKCSLYHIITLVIIIEGIQDLINYHLLNYLSSILYLQALTRKLKEIKKNTQQDLGIEHFCRTYYFSRPNTLDTSLRIIVELLTIILVK